jgi:uncharacterized protein
MICGFIRCADAAAAPRGSMPMSSTIAKWRVLAVLILIACFSALISSAQAGAMTRARTAYARGDYIKAVNTLTPPALHGDAEAQAFLGFMYENGYGAPQAYDAAADLYIRAAIGGNPFGQCMLGLMYDKGHGVPQDFILAYKWLNLAAAHTSKRQREYFLRLRNAVASKMSPDQIVEAQRLALLWAPGLR